MLNEEVIEKVTERLINRIEQGNEYILKEVGRSIKKIGTFNPTKANQLINIIKYGGSYEKIVNKLAEITRLNVLDIYKIFEEVAKNDYRFAKQFYKYRNLDYIPYEQNIALKNQIRSLASITAMEYVNLSNTTNLGFGLLDNKGNITYKGLRESYNNLIDEAVLSVSQGKETFNSAMQRQLKNIGENGLKVIYPTTYIDKNGIEKHHVRRIDSAIRMNMQSALLNLHRETQERFGKEFNADGVEITVHAFPAEDHQEAQGRQFSNEEFGKLQSYGSATTYQGKHIDLHLYPGSFRPISDLNCKHYTFSIVLGINKPEYTDEQLQKFIDDNNKGFEFEGKHYTMYEGSQLQRRIESEIRKQKEIQILGRESGQDEMVAGSQLKIMQLSKKYKELCDESGLKTKVERLKVNNFNRGKMPVDIAKEANILYNTGSTERNIELLLKARKRQEQIRNGEFNLNIIKEKQEIHNINSPLYKKGRSYFNITLEEEQELVNKLAGTGYIPATKKGNLTHKEICVTNKIIGKYINEKHNVKIDTNSFVIHYSKDGVHIVPGNRRKEK